MYVVVVRKCGVKRPSGKESKEVEGNVALGSSCL